MNRDAESSAIKLAAKLQDGAMPFDVLREAMRWAYADAARICRYSHQQYDDFHDVNCNYHFAALIEERAK